MFRKIILMTSLLILIANGSAFAQVYLKTGSVFTSNLNYYSTMDAYRIDLDPDLLAGGSVWHRLYSDSGYANQTFQSRVYFPATIDYAYATYNCDRYYWDTFYDSSGNVIGEIKFYPDQLQSPACSSNYTPTPSTTPPDSGSGDSGSSCTNCDLFNCPGWQEHMQGLEDIKNAIPPAPNWQEVANTFRDTITPKIKSDLQEILGEVDDPPPAPQPPDPPPTPPDLDDGGITPPTGENAPGLEDSGFDENDIKDQAPVIEEREDDSGGFIIDNPVDGLPSQEEFKRNIPDEGDAAIPGDPQELENQSPTPSEGDNTAPEPDEGTNTAPTPDDSGANAPIPDENGTAPLPNESGIAPLPSG